MTKDNSTRIKLFRRACSDDVLLEKVDGITQITHSQRPTEDSVRAWARGRTFTKAEVPEPTHGVSLRSRWITLVYLV